MGKGWDPRVVRDGVYRTSGIYTLEGLKPSADFIIFDSLWVYGAFGNILISIVSSSHFGKRPGSRDITVLGVHDDPHVSEKVSLY